MNVSLSVLVLPSIFYTWSFLCCVCVYLACFHSPFFLSFITVTHLFCSSLRITCWSFLFLYLLIPLMLVFFLPFLISLLFLPCLTSRFPFCKFSFSFQLFILFLLSPFRLYSSFSFSFWYYFQLSRLSQFSTLFSLLYFSLLQFIVHS